MTYHSLPNWQTLPELAPLLDLSDPPKNLYYQGDWNKNLFTNCAAVVGSRRMTDYGKTVLEKLIPALVFAKKTIISGFMYGTDQYAHQLALESGGQTIAVLGWGISEPLFDYDKKLAGEITKSGGLLLSEWETQKGALWTFPRRNRLVAAISSEVYITEADLKSGSLITADWAKKLKRELYAIPGPITSRTSAGTNELISSGRANAWLNSKSRENLPSSRR